MIENKKQYLVAKRKLDMLTASLSAPKKTGVPDIIEKVGRTQIQNLIDEIKLSIDEYVEQP